MESRQAVHEHRAGIGGVHQLFRDAIWGQRSDPFLPDLHRFAHGHPNVGVQHVGPLHRFHGVCLKAQLCVGFRGDGDVYKRQAYKLTGSLVAECIRTGQVLETVPLERYRELSDLFEQDEMCIRDRARDTPLRSGIRENSMGSPRLTRRPACF